MRKLIVSARIPSPPVVVEALTVPVQFGTPKVFAVLVVETGDDHSNSNLLGIQ